MELVRGLSMTDYCDQNNLSIRERLELFVDVCHAVQHAHQKGIIHRDIKPSNVLVTLHDGKPVVKVIDFGVAKALGQQLTDKTLFTNFAQMIGTPLYMSPEQADMSGLDVDTRSDIYSLGVLLYELLTGTTPFDKERLKQATFDEIRRIIREEEPPRPSTRMSQVEHSLRECGRTRGASALHDTAAHATTTAAEKRRGDPRKLSRLFRGELDWIVMKALEKDRNRRYETANGLAMDVQRYLHDEPVLACPPSVSYQLRKFGRKHGKLFTTMAAFALLLITLAAVASGSAWRLSDEQEATAQQLRETRKAEDQAKRDLYRSLVAQARANRLSRRTGRRVDSLEILAEATRLAKELQLPEDDFLELRNETIACLSLVDLRVARTWEGRPAGTVYVDFDANLESYVRVDPLENVASVCRVADDSEVCRITDFGQSKELWPYLSPDGRFLGVEDGRSVGLKGGGGPLLRVWKLRSHGAELLLQEPGHVLKFSPDSRRVATANADGNIQVYELPSGKQLKQLQTGRRAGNLAFHPTERKIAVRHPGRITVFDVDAGNKLAEFGHPGGEWDALEWYPDGKMLAAVGGDRCIYVWEASTGKLVHQLGGHTEAGIRVAINPAGDLLASNSPWEWDGTLRLWDARTGRELFKTLWAKQAVNDADGGHRLRFSRNGPLLAAEVTDHQLRLWQAVAACGYQSLVREPRLGKGKYFVPAVSSKHPLLAVGMEDGIGLWEFPGGRPLAFLPIVPLRQQVAFEPSGALLIEGGFSSPLRCPIEAVGPAGTLRIGPPQPLPFPSPSTRIATSRDGRVMASAQGWGALVHHAGVDELIRLEPQEDARFVAVSPEGEWVATGSFFATEVYAKIWESRTGRHVVNLPVEGRGLVGFSPDGRWLVTTGGGCRLWEVGTWREGLKIGGAWISHAFAFSPDSKVLAVEAGSGAVRLLDPGTGREYARLEDPNQDRAHALTFSPDGSQLLASTLDSPAVHAWDLRAIRVELAKCGLDWDLPPYPELGGRKDAPPLQVTVDLGDLPSRDQALELNNQAWLLATNPDAKLRDPARAVELAQKAVDLCPKHAMYRNTLGVAQYRAGSWKQAVAALDKSMELGNPPHRLDWFFLAMAHWQLGDQALARKWYRAAALWMDKYAPDNAELWRFREEAAELLSVTTEDLRQQLSGNADLEIWRLVLEAQPDSVLARWQRGELYSRLSLWDLGAADFAKAFQLQATPSAHLWFCHALLRVHVGDVAGYRKVAAQLPQHFKQTPAPQSGYWNELARALTVAPTPDVDLEWAREQAELSVKNHSTAWSHNALGLVHYRAGEYEQALGPLREALRLDTHWRYAILSHSVLAMAHHRLGQADEARQALTEADRKVEQWHQSLLELSLPPAGDTWWDLLEGLILYREAKILLEGSAPPDDPRPIVARACAFAVLGDRDKAEEACSRALELGAKNVGVRLACARIHAELHQYDKALADFTNAIDLDPKSAAAWEWRASVYFLLHQYENAVADLNKAIELDPKNAVTRNNRGVAHFRLGEWEKALADYSKALELEPDKPDAQNNLAYCLATCPETKLRDPKRAVELAQKAAKTAPKDGNVWVTLGAARYRTDDWKGAMAALQEAEKLLQPQSGFQKGVGRALFFQAMAQQELGNAKVAGQAYDRALQWLETNRKALEEDPPLAEELRRFQAEAEELLGIKNK
jgi:tetratricopeptide (TPR) repeat protein/WD40 repeat protein